MALRAPLRPSAACALAFFLASGTVDAADLMRLAVGRPVEVAGSLRYPIDVKAAGAPVVAILPNGTRLATLEVDGVEVQRAGSDALAGHRPLAHGGASLVFAGLRPGERVVLRVTGTRQPPQLYPLRIVATTYGSGVIAGMLYGLLATALLVQIVAIFGYREWTNLWYLGSLFDLTLVELVRNDVWEIEPQRLLPVLGACGVGLAILMTGFTASYLRLYREARRLFWWTVAANIVPGIALQIAGAAVALPGSDAWHFVPPLVGNVSLVLAAALRWRAGYKPAGFLLLGLCSLCIYFATSIAIGASSATVPIFDWWGFEIAVALDVLLFSLGMAYRDRYSKRAHNEVERKLRAATFAADHDPLTGLLNRRGLEAWLAATPHVMGTLLYLDLDGFKAVNDRGGHAAGDDTLRVVARIIAHAVREEDQVARLGGDEFAAVLRDVRNPETVERISARIRDAIGSLRPLGLEADVRIGVSAGIGAIAEAGSFEDALREADRALYREKSLHHAGARMS